MHFSPKAFWRFQGVYKWNIGLKGVKLLKLQNIFGVSNYVFRGKIEGLYKLKVFFIYMSMNEICLRKNIRMNKTCLRKNI